MTLKRLSRVLAGAGVSGCCLLIAFRTVPVRQVWDITTAIPVVTILTWLLFASISLALRALRWGVVLKSARPISFGLTFAVNSAGQFGNAVLPARLGDVFRGTTLGRAGVSCGFALATVLVERVLDTGFLVFVSAIALGSFEGRPTWLMRAAIMLGTVAAAGLAAALLLPRFEPGVLRLVRWAAPLKVKERLVGVVQQFVMGLRSLHNPRDLTKFFLLTIVVWFLDSVGVVILGRGLLIALSPVATILLLTSVALSSAVPAGTIGVYQMVTVAVLSPFGVARSQALGLAILLEVLIVLNLLTWGSASLWYLAWHHSRFGRKQPSKHDESVDVKGDQGWDFSYRRPSLDLAKSAAAPMRSPIALRAFARFW